MTRKWRKACGFSLLALSLTSQCYATPAGDEPEILSVPNASSAANAVTVSVIETISEVMVKLNHLQLLANKAAGGVNSSSQLSLLNSEFQLDKREILNLLENSTLNNVPILNGGTLSFKGTYSLQPFTSEDLAPGSDSIETVAKAKQAQQDLLSAPTKLNTLMPDSGLVASVNSSSVVVFTIKNRMSGVLADERMNLKHSIVDVLNQMSDLATKAATGNYSPSQLSNMNTQFGNLQAEINHIVDNTQFSQVKLFANTKLETDGNKAIKMPYMDAKLLGIKDLDISTVYNAQEATQSVSAAMVKISGLLINKK